MADTSILEAARKIQRFISEGEKAAVGGMRVVGELIMTDVKASRPGRGVPVDTGTLRSTGRVVEDGKDILLVFGGSAAPYALVQHERLDFQHTVGEARYLVRGVERFKKEGGKAADKALAEQMQFAIEKARGVG